MTISSLRPQSSQRRPLILFFLFMGGLINYLDRAVMGVLAPLISTDLDLDPAELGWAFSMFYVGYAASTFFGGQAADRFGPKIVLGVSMAVWSILCGLTGVVTSLFALLFVRLAFGAWESPWIPGSNKMISQVVPKEQYASAFGLVSSGQTIGGAIAGPLIALAAYAVGWRLSFGLVASIGLIWVVGWYFAVRNVELGATPSSPGGLQPQASAADVGLKQVLKQPAVLATCVTIGSANYVQAFFLMWFPSYLSADRGMDQIQIGMMSAFPWILGTIGLIVGGFLSDFVVNRFGRGLNARKIVLTACLLPASLCVALVPLVSDSWTAVALMAVAIGLLFMAGPNYFATINQVAPQRHLGAALGLLVLFTTIAGVISPALTGELVKYSGNYTSSFIVSAAMIIFANLVYVFFARLPAGK